VHSLGVDTWGVDYGLLDDRGALVEDPVCYRDSRTDGVMDAVFDLVPRAEVFVRTGIQFMPLNTLFQVFAHLREGLPGSARRLLLMPDLIGFMLSGRGVTEFSIARRPNVQRVGRHVGPRHAGAPGHSARALR